MDIVNIGIVFIQSQSHHTFPTTSVQLPRDARTSRQSRTTCRNTGRPPRTCAVCRLWLAASRRLHPSSRRRHGEHRGQKRVRDAGLQQGCQAPVSHLHQARHPGLVLLLAGEQRRTRHVRLDARPQPRTRARRFITRLLVLAVKLGGAASVQLPPRGPPAAFVVRNSDTLCHVSALNLKT